MPVGGPVRIGVVGVGWRKPQSWGRVRIQVRAFRGRALIRVSDDSGGERVPSPSSCPGRLVRLSFPPDFLDQNGESGGVGSERHSCKVPYFLVLEMKSDSWTVGSRTHVTGGRKEHEESRPTHYCPEFPNFLRQTGSQHHHHHLNHLQGYTYIEPIF